MSGEGRRFPVALGLAGLALAGLAGVVALAVFVLVSEDGALRGSPGAGSLGSSQNRPIAVAPTSAPKLAGESPLDGGHVALADFRGKAVVVNVWASWCPGCNEEAVDLREFAAEHSEVAVLGVDFRDSVEGARAFYRRWRWVHPSIFDASGSDAAELAVFGLPTTVFLDARHRVVARVVGATDRAGFEHGLALATRGS